MFLIVQVSPHCSLVQIFFSEPCSQTPSICDTKHFVTKYNHYNILFKLTPIRFKELNILTRASFVRFDDSFKVLERKFNLLSCSSNRLISHVSNKTHKHSLHACVRAYTCQMFAYS
jgi:hypothetical protein